MLRRALKNLWWQLNPENMMWGAGGNDYISIATQNTSVTADRVVGLIEESMQQLFRKGARKYAANAFQICVIYRQADASI